jgi:translation initiation factor 3 subunit B
MPLLKSNYWRADLKAQFEVKADEGLDTFVVIDGLPVVPEDSKQKLIKFLLRKLNTVGNTSEDAVFMPVSDKGMSEGCVQEDTASRFNRLR